MGDEGSFLTRIEGAIRDELELGDGFPEGGDLAAVSGEALVRGDDREVCCFDAAGMTGVAAALPEGVLLALLPDVMVGVGKERG